MRKVISSALIVLLSAAFLIAEQETPLRQREWLKDVSPIITKTEREVFSKLRTDAERDRFIQLFWRQRDPYPDTAENEFEKQYMERVRFADQNFGRGTSKRGSQTDRGYYYLLLGPPLERTYFIGQSELWPMELWFYKGEVAYGLPAYFYLIFFQPQGLGDYRLYSPGVDGPAKLVSPITGSTNIKRSEALEIIKKVNSELASAAVSYLPSDQREQTGPLSTNTILANIANLPEKKFSSSYARTYLDYKDYITTEYTHDYIESTFMCRAFRQDGQFFIHWALEPKKINFAERNGTYQAFFSLVLRVEDNAGNLVLEKEGEIPLTVTPEQFKAHASQILSFQDLLPLIPGRFKILGLLKNKTAQDFASFTSLITVPEGTTEFRFGDRILYHNRERMSEAEARQFKAFSFSENHYLVNTRNEFPVQGELGAYVQVFNLQPRNLSPQAAVLFEIRSADTENVVFSQQKPLAEALTSDGEGLDIGPFSLSTIKPGYYFVDVSVINENNQKLATARENLILLSQAYTVVPWVYAKTHQPFPNPEFLLALSTEYFMTGQQERAYELAERRLKIQDDPQARMLLAKILLAMGRCQDSLNVVRPVYDADKSRDAAKIMAAGYVGLKDWSSALVYLERLMAEATETSVLNMAGECYLNLNQPGRALEVLERSLQIDPNQTAVKDLVEKTKAGAKE